MNADQVGGIVRAFLAAVGFFGALLGVFSADQWAAIAQKIGGPLIAFIGAAISLGTVAWSIWTNSTKQMAISVSEKPEITKVVSPSLSLETPDSPKVVAH